MAAILALEYIRGDGLKLALTFYQGDETGPTVDLAGYKSHMRIIGPNGDEIIYLTTENGGITLTPGTSADPNWVAEIASSVGLLFPLTPSPCTWSILLIPPNLIDDTPIRGTFTILDAPTSGA